MAVQSDGPRPEKAKGKWTIHDLARKAGVSAKTISRVVNEEAGVAEATRVRILRLIQEVGYEPHIGARSMRSSPKDSVGVTLSAPINEVRFSRDFFFWVFEKLYDILGSKGVFVTFDLNPYAGGTSRNYGRGLWQQRYGACIVLGPLANNDTTLRRIDEAGYPYLALGRLGSFPEASSAAVDFEEGCYISTRHLIERGHKRIAMLKAFDKFYPGLERRRGYLRALKEADIEPDEDLIRSVQFGSAQTTQFVHRLLLNEDITALVDCSATEDAESIREGARRAGRVAGQDFEVVSWTYTHNATVLSEACAHVWVPVREAADEGFELFAQWLSGEREGPVQVLYRPILYQPEGGGELSKPTPLFDKLF